MSQITLTCNTKGDKRFKECKFVIDELTLDTTNDDEFDVDYENITAYFDGEKYTGGISTWSSSNVSADFLFESVLSSYLRDNTDDFENFSDSWDIFKKFKDLAEWNDDLLIKFPQYDGCRIRLYELDLAVPGFRYYGYQDYCLMLNEAGGVVTDIENFYTNSMIKDLVAIFKGEMKCLYKSENVDYWIKEEFGSPEDFLKEYESLI